MNQPRSCSVQFSIADLGTSGSGVPSCQGHASNMNTTWIMDMRFQICQYVAKKENKVSVVYCF